MKEINPNQVFVDSLGDLPLFKCLALPQREALLQCAQVLAFDAGESVFHEDNPAEAFYIIKTGRVKMRRLNVSGKEIILHLSTPPHMIGCKSLTMPGSRYPADAIAVEDSILLRFKRGRFLTQVAHTPDVFFHLLIELNRRLSEIYTLQASIQEPVARRIATFLMNQALPEVENWEIAAQQKLKPIRVTKVLIASIVGTTTETAIRIVSGWKKKGWVASERGVLEILNLKAIYRLSKGLVD